MILKIAAFAVPLGFDTFAISVLLGLRGMRALRPALTFAAFEAAMPLMGLLLGRAAGARFESWAGVLGGCVLLGVAASVLREALEGEDEAGALGFDSLPGALLAGFAVSMDEVAIGFPMGASGLPIPATLVAIGVQAFLVSLVGIAIGRRAGAALGRRASFLAGIVAAAAFGVLGAYLIAQRFAPGLPAM